jgi:hypothetical protein
MANLPAARSTVVILFCLLGCNLSAQILPFAPISPTDAKECQSFSRAVDDYAAEYSAQHEKCLAENKPDRPDETHNSLVCSKSRCQYLHDMPYDGNSFLSVKSKQKEVSACYEKLREYQAEEARKAKEKAEEETQEKQDDADRAARRAAQDAPAQKKAADLTARKKADLLLNREKEETW